MKKMTLSAATVIGAFLLFSCGGPDQSNEQNNNNGKDTATTETSLEDAEIKRENFTLNLDSSRVLWSGNMIGLYSHEGWVKLKEGNIEVSNGKISGGTFVVDMTSITPTDENYNVEEGNTKEKLVEHLSSDDFFLVSEYPTATFEITGADINNNQLTGDLTIRGITHEETIENVKFNREEGTASGDLVFDRSVYDVKFKHPAQEMVLSDDIELHIQLHTTTDVQANQDNNESAAL